MSDDVISCSLDDLGEYATICIDTRVFSETAIMKTAYWLTEEYFLFLFRDTKDPATSLSVELRLKDPAENTQKLLETACRKFGNHLIDQEVRQVVQTETAAFRDALVQKAFFEGRPRTGMV